MTTYTVLSARYSNPDHTAAVAMTEEVAAVVLSAVDTPEAWAAMLASVTPEPYTPPQPPVPEPISDRQFAQGLAVQGYITTAEALAWVGPGTLPAVFETLLAGLPPAEAFQARMLLTGATEFRRHHPLVDVIGTTNGWSPEAIDDFWRFCATL